jgi:DNA-binding transcriptional regulator YiaG
MNEDKQISPLVSEMVTGLSAFCDAIEAGEPIEKRFTIRTVKLDLKPKPYGPEDVKHVRDILKASQTLLARFLGVSVNSVRSWEQGTRPVPAIACRYMDDIIAYPDIWRQRLQAASQEKAAT